MKGSGNGVARWLGPAAETLTAASARRFKRALESPGAAQRERLAAVLRAVAGSRQAARIAGFRRIRSAREFQDAVPLRRPDELGPDVREAARGVSAVLTHQPVQGFERSGGTSGPSKLVPHTRALRGEFQAALLPWLHDLARTRPRAWEGPGYWSISPLAQRRAVTEGGIRIGADDAAYFPGPMRRLLAQVLAVPGAVARLPDVASCRYVTLRLLLQTRNLALMSAWNPSFLTLMIDALDEHAERLLEDLAAGTCHPPAPTDASGRTGDEAERAAVIHEVVETVPLRADPERARELARVLADRGRLEPSDLWPHLALLSVWTDAHAARALPALRARFGGVEVQGKGLLAAEGVVSIPWTAAPAPVLAVRSHFLEFIEADAPLPRPRLAHELEDGRLYEVVISTGAGFLRYRLGDLVRVVGRYGATPCVRFEGRADAVSDLRGEKLSARRVGEVLARVFSEANGDADAPRFALLAPEWADPPGYRLYLESKAPDAVLETWGGRIEEMLCEGFSYGYARALGQLGPVCAVRVCDGARRYEARCVALGQRAGDVKPSDLDTRAGWSEWMTADGAREIHATVG